MRYKANLSTNLMNAINSKDAELFKDIVLDELATMIEQSPEKVIELIRKSGIDISDNASKKTIIDKASDALYSSQDFHSILAKAMIEGSNNRKPVRPEFSNNDGGSSSQGGGDASNASSIVSAIASAIGSGFEFGRSKNELKAEETKTKSILYSKILGGEGEDKGVNWLPIVAIGGVLVIAGIVVFKVIGNKGR